MAIEQDWDKSDLRDILMQDNWFPLFAFWTIAGIYLERDDPPDEYFTYLGYVEEEACSPAWFRGRDEREHIVERLQKIWSANSYDIPKPPEFFIKWAIQRDQPPEWLGWAKEKMLYIPEESTDSKI
jgi:hypothetical protein